MNGGRRRRNSGTPLNQYSVRRLNSVRQLGSSFRAQNVGSSGTGSLVASEQQIPNNTAQNIGILNDEIPLKNEICCSLVFHSVCFEIVNQTTKRTIVNWYDMIKHTSKQIYIWKRQFCKRKLQLSRSEAALGSPRVRFSWSRFWPMLLRLTSV